jgi:5-formyltetrahydrofolate cyclo-ligase
MTEPISSPMTEPISSPMTEPISSPMTEPIETEPLKVGVLRERIWSDLVKNNAAAFPLPPHGHNPNFKGARAAAKHLLKHPLLESAKVVLVGMEAALLPLRGLLLSAGKTLVVPHRTKAGAFWRLEHVDKSAARIENFHLFGVACDLKTVELAVLASVAVAKDGGRLSKGFGFGARGAPIDVPVLTIAHSKMVFLQLEVVPDSWVQGFATPEQLAFIGLKEVD